MKFSLVLVFLLTLLWVSPVSAFVILKSPNTIKVLAANGEEIEAKSSLRLPDGVNQIVFRIDTELPGNDVRGGDIIYSDVLVGRFEATSQALTIRVPKILREYDLRQFNQEPDVQLVTQTGEPVPLVLDKLTKEGFQLMRDYAVELEAYNQTGAPAAVDGAATRVSGAASAGGNLQDSSWAAPPAEDQTTAEQMLKYWYQQADDETQQRFWEWISQ